MYIEYNSNNSGGYWWLEDEDWKALEAAGWVIEWASLENLYNNEGNYIREENGLPKLVPIGEGNSQSSSFADEEDGEFRYLGALAKIAYKPHCDNLKEAVSEWEKITGQSSLDAGCPCCGNPHNFTLYDDDGKYVDSGPDSDYVCNW